MENRSHRTGEELAETKKELFSFRSSSSSSETAGSERIADPISPPTVQIEFKNDIRAFMPADFLICEYGVELLPEHDISAIETSVVWLTEGKGDTDIGVHFFERRQSNAITNETFQQKQRLSTVLPSSPLSYEGKVLSIRWCVRVRIFLADGTHTTVDEYLTLGKVGSHTEIADSLTDDSIEDSDDAESTESGAA